MMKKWFCLLLLLLLLSPVAGTAGDGFVFLASTIGPIDSGVVGLLEDEFEKETGIRVRHVGAGTGAALDIARKGNVDLVLVHAKSLEEKFVQEGFGTERIDLMYNDFVIVGPAADPAGIKGMKSAAEALKKISEAKGLFISRGDRSGTHIAEMNIWEKAGLKPQAKTEGNWYQVYEKGMEGNVPTLRFVNSREGYTVIDRATYLALKNQISLAVLVEGDGILLNYISLIPVNPAKFPRANYRNAMAFVGWLVSPDQGQRIISTFGKDKFGSPLFFANSKEWKNAKNK